MQSVSQLPTLDWRSDVRYYDAIVKLEKTPDGLRPGMTAQIEIAMPQRKNVLAVPSEAIGLADGHDVCFVVHEDGLERRDVKVGEVTRELTEVTNGLREGETGRPQSEGGGGRFGRPRRDRAVRTDAAVRSRDR